MDGKHRVHRELVELSLWPLTDPFRSRLRASIQWGWFSATLGDPDRVLSGGPRWGYGDPREPSGLLARAIRSARSGHERERKEEGDPGRPERVPPENVGQPVGPQIDAGGAHHEGDQGRARPYEGPAPIRCARRKDDREHRVEGNRLGGVTRGKRRPEVVSDPEGRRRSGSPDRRLRDVV